MHSSRAAALQIDAALGGPGTQQQIVLAAEQGEGPLHVQLDALVARRVLAIAAKVHGAGQGVVHIAQQLFGHVDFLVHQLQLGLPALAEVVLQPGEQVQAFLLVAGPARTVVVGARHPAHKGAGTGIGLEGRGGAGAVQRAFAVGDTGAQQGVGREVVFQRAVDHADAGVLVVAEAAGALFRQYQPPAQAAFGVQRAGDVGICAVAVPAAGAGFHVGLEVLGRALADQVDRGAVVAVTVHQAGRALEHLDAVDVGQVVHGVERVGVEAPAAGELARAVHLQVGGAAPHVVGDHLVLAAHRQAGCLLHHIGQRLQLEVFHALAGEDGDRLRGLAQR